VVRLISGVVLAASAIAAVLFLPLAGLRVLAAVVAVLAAHEYLRIAGTTGIVRQLPALAATVLLFAIVVADGDAVDLPLIFAVALAWLAVDVLATGRPIQAAAAGLVAPIYVGVPMAALVLIHTRLDWPATMLLVFVVVVSDSAQYYSGRMFGRRPLAPAISPKKTIEGAIGGLVAGILFMALVGSAVLPAAGLVTLAMMGAVLVVAGIAGDLFESRLKRSAGMKDSSALIPGHGGILDRIDALLFAAPVFYLYLRYAG
jgi:phosphatidate cytidylyltransferase